MENSVELVFFFVKENNQIKTLFHSNFIPAIKKKWVSYVSLNFISCKLIYIAVFETHKRIYYVWRIF